MPKESILKEFNLFSLGEIGIGAWLSESTDSVVFDRIDSIDKTPLSKVQLNQLLVLGHEAPLSDGFFRYYWMSDSPTHTYPVDRIPGFSSNFIGKKEIISLEHLKWGIYRLFTDGLLYFGNVRSAYRQLRDLNENELVKFFSEKKFDTSSIKARGPALTLKPISKDNRYLISEMACKSFGDDSKSSGELRTALKTAYDDFIGKNPRANVTFRELIESQIPKEYDGRQYEFQFSSDAFIDDNISDIEDFEKKVGKVADDFFETRKLALQNTNYYLSMVSDLDVYVATSMRSRQNFRDMATFCENVFNNPRLNQLQLRYFDPTLSASPGHEDKGLIECLMVKCAKVLVYFAGDSDSYGKDAEAAMALSLGKPVIFYCNKEQKRNFFRDVHPLSRLIEFGTGIAVGAMVTDTEDQVVELLYRLFENKMEYNLDSSNLNYLRLKESLTGSVVRLQTRNRLLAETFWNHYHK